MDNIGNYYWRMLTDISFAEGKANGVLHSLSFLSIITMIFLLILSVLIIRARPASAENRFMSVLLAAEAIKVAEAWYNVYPVGSEWLPLISYFRVIGFFAIILSLFMYLSTCAFYPVTGLRFMTKSYIRQNLWWGLPLVSAGIVGVLIHNAGGITEAFGGLLHIHCLAGQEAQPAVVTVYPFTDEPVVSLCTEDANYLPFSYVAPENTDISRLLFLCPVFIAMVAMVMMRNAWKHLGSSEQAAEARALFLGFAGKTVFKGALVIFMISITVRFGEFNPADVASISDKNLLILYLVSIYGFLASILFTGMFEGIMVSYAILKREVLGIDEQLRKAFTAAVVTGSGGVFFLILTELMEELIGVGWLGGVLLGVLFLILRKPLFIVLEKLSRGLMPEAHTAAEESYLEAYSLAMQNQEVTEHDRKFLQLQAKALNLTSDRIAYLEQYWNSSNQSAE